MEWHTKSEDFQKMWFKWAYTQPEIHARLLGFTYKATAAKFRPFPPQFHYTRTRTPFMKLNTEKYLILNPHLPSSSTLEQRLCHHVPQIHLLCSFVYHDHQKKLLLSSLSKVCYAINEESVYPRGKSNRLIAMFLIYSITVVLYKQTGLSFPLTCVHLGSVRMLTSTSENVPSG